MAPAKSEETPKPKTPPVPINFVGQPDERCCGTCEHWELSRWAVDLGDCHNLISGLRITKRLTSCARGYYPCTTRFPLEVRYHAPAR